MWTYISTFLICTLKLTEGRLLDDYIQHYEELHYSTDSLHRSHLRAKRSVTNPNLNLKFKAFGRDFDLQLQRSTSIFTSDHRLRHSNGSEEDVDTSFIYEGKLRGIKDSFAHGAVIEGVFRGFVDVPGDTTYHIEHSRRFFGKGHPVHSIIYSEKHLNLDPYKHRRGGRGTCGVDNLSRDSIPIGQKKSASQQTREQYHNMYVRERNADDGKERRYKRDTSTTKKVNTCNLYMRSDPLLHKHFVGAGSTDQVAKDEILALFSSSVAVINQIYRKTNFTTYDGSKWFFGRQFQVQRSTIMTDTSAKCSSSIRASKYCNPYIDVSNFLDLNSLDNHDQFCLAYVFTARDFLHGTLGLAGVASPKRGIVGGVCERYRQYKDGSKSLNTGIVTIINYQKQVAPKVTYLTFAHEIGHNFGSPHDTGQTCAPFNTNAPDASKGNYIMYASATQGDLQHNSEFSVCSRDNISLVLYEITEGNKHNCFEESDAKFCGNGLLEEGEECDCGYASECDDKCCNPKQSDGGSSAEACTLRKDSSGNQYECSPSQGPCCSAECKFVNETSKKVCRIGTECVKKATCKSVFGGGSEFTNDSELSLPMSFSTTDGGASTLNGTLFEMTTISSGRNSSCPEADNYPDILTYCNNNKSVCENGVCSGSLCKRVGYTNFSATIGYEDCFTSGTSKDNMCYLSCKNKNSTTCLNSVGGEKINDAAFQQFLIDFGISGKPDPINLPAGSPCDNFKGFCDPFSRCRSIDNESALERLKNLVFSEETLTKIVETITEYWWAVMLGAIGLVIFMAIFIKVCAVHTPSSNPKATPARKPSDILRMKQRPNKRSNNEPPPQYDGPTAGGQRRQRVGERY